MLILAASASVSVSFSRARVSQSSTFSRTATTTTCSVPGRSRASRCLCSVELSKIRAMAELVEDKASMESKNSSLPGSATVLAAASKEMDFGNSRTFLNVRSGEELLSGIRKETEAGRLPPNIAAVLEELFQNYWNAVFQSGNSRANEIVLSNMAVTFNRILLDVEDPFTFSPHHRAIREPFDYYTFGQNYIRPLVDFRRSYVGNISLFYDLGKKLQQGHNIVLISNHQTEADPAIIALLLETTNPQVAEMMTYVAGDRVVTDPVCKPFSMGRNLLCVYSKKHMHDSPELVEMKKRTGSQIIWIAPSGGRDRPDPSTGEWHPAPFDSSAVDNIRRLLDHSRVPGHIYPLALLCHDIMPPPPQVEKQIGERRMISFHGVGLSVAPPMSFTEIASGQENPEEAKEAFSNALYNSVCEQYNVLKYAIYDNQGLGASNSAACLSQPWL